MEDMIMIVLLEKPVCSRQKFVCMILFTYMFVVKQLGREKNSFWKDTIPEPHHTYHAMGKTYKVHLHNYNFK